MIDLATTEVIPIRKAATLCTVHEETVRMWISRGKRGVKLEALIIGNRLCTSLPALQKFLEAVSARPLRKTPTTANAAVARTERERLRAVKKATAALEAAGA